ncbi:MAG: fibronectin type III domain-containing protein [Polyangiaceae bacterium]
MTLFGPVFGCGSDGHSFIEPAGNAGRTARAGASATSGAPGESPAGSGGDAGSAPDEGVAGTAESAAGDSSDAGDSQGGNAGKGGSAGSGGAAAVSTLPSAPSELVLKIASATSVHLAWTDNADNEAGYALYWSATASKPKQPNKKLPAPASSGAADGLTMGQEYNFWVEAYNDLGASTDITGKATPLPVPAAPTGLTIEAGAVDAVLKWTDAAVNETGYRIYRATSNAQPALAQYELTADASTYTVLGSDIDPYTKYYYWVVAYNSAGESIAATVSGTTGVKPLMPTGVTVDTKTSVWSVSVSWIDNSQYSSSFNVYWSTGDTKPALPGASVSGDKNTYKMQSVLAKNTYRFWIESVNAIGTSDAAKGVANDPTYELGWTDLYFDPTANTIRQGVLDTFGLVSDKDSSTGLFGYHTPDPTLDPALFSATSGSALTPAVNWNPTSAGIDVSKTQYFWSQAQTPNGSSFSVRSLVPPGALGALSATPSQLSVALSWAAVTPVGGYQIYKGSSTTFANASSYAVQTGKAITVVGLNPGTAYSFWVRPLGVGLNGTGLPGATVTQTVTTTGPNVGSNLALNKTAVASSAKTDSGKVLDGSVTTHWQAASTATTEWIYVNLGEGNSQNITHVKLVWESAYATSFDIQVCDAACDDNATLAVDSWAWVTGYSGSTATLSGFPNYQFVTLTTPTTGQFIRMKPKTLSGASGASLDEFEVFSASP